MADGRWGRQYLDAQGRRVIVSAGISSTSGQKPYWAAYRRKPSGSLQRITTKFLPLRGAPDKAQADLDAYARRKGWPACE